MFLQLMIHAHPTHATNTLHADHSRTVSAPTFAPVTRDTLEMEGIVVVSCLYLCIGIVLYNFSQSSYCVKDEIEVHMNSHIFNNIIRTFFLTSMPISRLNF